MQCNWRQAIRWIWLHDLLKRHKLLDPGEKSHKHEAPTGRLFTAKLKTSKQAGPAIWLSSALITRKPSESVCVDIHWKWMIHWEWMNLISPAVYIVLVCVYSVASDACRYRWRETRDGRALRRLLPWTGSAVLARRDGHVGTGERATFDDKNGILLWCSWHHLQERTTERRRRTYETVASLFSVKAKTVTWSQSAILERTHTTGNNIGHDAMKGGKENKRRIKDKDKTTKRK